MTRKTTRVIFHTILFVVACCLMTACGNKASFDTNLLTKTKKLYEKAAKRQKDGDYDKAKALYDSLLHIHTNDSTTNDSILPIASKAITQIMNTMQSQGKPDECVEYLRKLKTDPNIMTGDMCKRDISVTLAYAISRTEDIDGAVKEMDQAMRMKPCNPTHDRLFRDYAYACAVYFCKPERKEDVNRYGTMAIREISQCDNKSGESWITALLGMSFIRSGELSNAMNMFKQSYDNASDRHDTLSMANTLNLMANIMINWSLYDYANEYATKAVAMSGSVRDKNPKICSNILANKALIMEKFGYADSAKYYLKRSHEFTKDLPYNSGNSDIDLIRGELLSDNPQTRAEGLNILSHVAHNATSGISTKAYYTLAKEYLANAEMEKGEAALDSTISTLSINTSPILVNNIYEYALDYYVSTNNKEKIVKLAHDLNKSNKILSNNDVLKQTAESIVDFKTRERVEELNWQQIQIEQKKKFFIIYSIVIMLVFIGVTVAYFIKRRYAILRQKFAEQQLVNLSYKLETMARDKQLLADQLISQKQQHETKSNAKMPDFSTTNIQDKDGENRFRSMFDKLHPDFIAHLRDQIPGISRREEMLAMLIAMKLDNNQIEQLMCIARSSINMARYRLRTKMGLNREDSLEEAILNILEKK